MIPLFGYLLGYVSSFTFKVWHGLAPLYSSELISVMSSSRYNLRSSNNGILLTFPSSKSKKTLGDRAFMFAAPKLWNARPRDIRTTNTVESFKCKLKTYLFKGAFC